MNNGWYSLLFPIQAPGEMLKYHVPLFPISFPLLLLLL